MKINELPSQKFLLECFDYKPKTGELIWKDRPEAHFASPSKCKRHHTLNAGRAAGTVNVHGYRVIRLTVDGVAKLYPAHRIVWAIVNGAFSEVIDHINGVRSDNRIANLRVCTQAENTASSQFARKVGLRGAFYDKSRGKWLAQLHLNYKSIHLGRFDTEAEAHAAYVAAKQQHSVTGKPPS